MSKTPIDAMLDLVKWEPINADQENYPDENSLPIATHRGLLRIGDYQLEVFQLSNGERVISKQGLDDLFRLGQP
jgi:hypothetical protein